jgi:hypothetical protein
VSVLDALNGADLVACGILAVIALWAALWAIMEYTPRLIRRVLSALARWHARQIIKANTPEPFPPSAVEWAPLAVLLPLVALVLAIIAECGVGR